GQGSARVMAVPSREIRRREIASPEEARRVYGVDFVLAGTAEENGSGVRFRIRLIDSAEARETGAATFDYQPSNPAAGRQRATAEAAKLLHLEVAAAADKAGAEPGASDAFAAYLEARGFMARFEVPGSGNLDKAIAAYERATERDPKFALAWAGLGEAWWRRSRAGGGKEAADKARSSAERGVQLGPNLAMTHAILGAVYSTAGKQEEATAELRKALRISPENADAARELARLLARAGRRKDAEASYLASIRSRPTDWYGYLLLGLFYYSGEQYQEAEAALKRAIKLAPANEIALRDLGGIYMVQGRYPEALEALQRSLKNHQASRTYMSLATTYFYMHRFREASTAGETAVDLDPSRHDHWGNLGIFYKWTPGSESRSEAALRKAVELAEKRLLGTPGDSSVYADLAEYRARLGDKAGSMAAIEKIPQAARQGVASRLAIAYELCGNRTQAVEFLRSTVKNAATLSLIRDDPDLAGLWADARFQQAIAAVLKSKA
ncbi:MAG: tetratricopeptide repeat protein, partial [Bryobacteraceae bacterium]|nr:tetratricopeptide repeat protein [Bryobacteraceae bacterium]